MRLPQELKADKKYLEQHSAGVSVTGTLNPDSVGILGEQDGNGGGNGAVRNVYLDKAFPHVGVAGTHVLRINHGVQPAHLASSFK